MRRHFAALAAAGALLAAICVGSAQADTRIVDKLLYSVSAKLSPQKLPRDSRAPVAVSIAYKVAMTDGTAPPSLKQLKIQINRHGILDSTGLPVCPYSKIQPAATSRALRNCRAALVGRGRFGALVGLKGQESYVTRGKMVVFNGRVGGKPVLFGHLYSGYPFAASFVITFKVSRRKRGEYGTVLTATMPANLRAWGNLTEIEMRLFRKYGYVGERRSFLSAGCPTPKGFPGALFRLARTDLSFADGRHVSSTLTDICKVSR